jgi:hypothetical protein
MEVPVQTFQIISQESSRRRDIEIAVCSFERQFKNICWDMRKIFFLNFFLCQSFHRSINFHLSLLWNRRSSEMEVNFALMAILATILSLSSAQQDSWVKFWSPKVYQIMLSFLSFTVLSEWFCSLDRRPWGRIVIMISQFLQETWWDPWF